MKKIRDGVDRIMQDCQQTIADRNIMRKSLGQSFKSSIEHTKGGGPKHKPERGGSVFPNRGNMSAISRSVQIEGKIDGIAKARPQSHPGKATRDKAQLKFCTSCGIYVTSKCTLQEICQTHTLSDMGQHETRTTLHKDGLANRITFVDCKDCSRIHPVGPCPSSGA